MYNPLKQRHKHKGFWGAVIGGVLGAATSGMFGQSSANKQMSYQKEALKNRHQWEIADLKKAGLNPIISAHGSPPVPSGASATMPPPLTVATMASAKKMEAETELIKVRTAKEGATKPLWEGGGAAVKSTYDKVLDYFRTNANSAKDAAAAPASKLQSTIPSNSAQAAAAVAQPGSKMHKAINWLLKGRADPIATTYTPRSPAYKKALAKVKALVKGKSPAVQKRAYDYFNKKWKGKK